MKKLLIIDGSSMLVTCYYANLPNEIKYAKTEEARALYYHKILHTSNGIYTNAVYGMLRIVKRLLDNQKPDYICFCFDRTRNTFRREMYSDYKVQRKATPSPLSEQFGTIQNVLSELGFMVVSDPEYEADDLAGSIAKRFEKGAGIYLLTKDHDYLQLVNEYARVWMVMPTSEIAKKMYNDYYAFYGINPKSLNLPNRVFEYTPDYVKEIEGVYPEQIPDLKGIVGDISDNIPGVKGVSSAAIPLISEYGSIENIYEEIKNCNDDKKKLKDLQEFWKTSLGVKRSPLKALTKVSDAELVGEQAALLSKKLATIKTDIKIPFNLEDLNAEYDDHVLTQICERLEIKKL